MHKDYCSTVSIDDSNIMFVFFVTSSPFIKVYDVAFGTTEGCILKEELMSGKQRKRGGPNVIGRACMYLDAMIDRYYATQSLI